jgi:hypothetical protein
LEIGGKISVLEFFSSEVLTDQCVSVSSSKEEKISKGFSPDHSLPAIRIHSHSLEMQIQRHKEQEPYFPKCNIVV